MKSTAKAFGKVLLFGAYAILEPGNIGCSLTINKGTSATVQETRSGQIIVDLRNFEIEVQGVVEGHMLNLKKKPDFLRYIKSAVRFSYEYLSYKEIKVKDIRIISFNDPELYVDEKLKTGFGTSATSTVSTVAAILHLHGIDDPHLIYHISRFSHYQAQGELGSGYDIGSAVYGSHYFLSQDPPGNDFIQYLNSAQPLSRQGFTLPPKFLPLLIFSGKSASTADLVNKVLHFKKKHPEKYHSFMEQYNEVNQNIRRAFVESWQEDIRMLLEKSWEMRRELGNMSGAKIEPKDLSKLLLKLKENGAYTACLAGAGGGDTIIALCNNQRDKMQLEEYCNRKKLEILDINLQDNTYQILA